MKTYTLVLNNLDESGKGPCGQTLLRALTGGLFENSPVNNESKCSRSYLQFGEYIVDSTP